MKQSSALTISFIFIKNKFLRVYFFADFSNLKNKRKLKKSIKKSERQKLNFSDSENVISQNHRQLFVISTNEIFRILRDNSL